MTRPEESSPPPETVALPPDDDLCPTVMLGGLLLLAVSAAAKAAAAAGSVASSGAPWVLVLLWPLTLGDDAGTAAIWLLAAGGLFCWPAIARHRFWRRAVKALLGALFVALCLYMLANVHLFVLLGTPLNVRYLVFAGKTGDLFSSLRGDAPWLAGGLILAYVVGMPFAWRLWRRRVARKLAAARKILFLPPLRGRARIWALGIALLLCWPLGRGLLRVSGLRGELNAIRKNAPMELVSSLLDTAFESDAATAVDLDPDHPTRFDASSPFTADDSEFNRCDPVADGARRKYNVAIWIMESWTAQDLQLYGDPHPNAPRLSALSDHAMVFDRYYSPSPVSIKALFNIFCSMYPYPEFEFITSIHPRIPCSSLSEVLAEHGYRGALFHGGHFEFTNKLAFFDERGFETLVDSTAFEGSKKYYTFGWGVEDRAMVDKAVEWLDREHPAPFLIVFIPIIPHYPYILPPGNKPRFSTRTLKSRYHNGIHYEDELVGKFHDALAERGLADDTLHIVVGDHGQAFQQHPHNRLHANFLYQENTWIPLVMINPHLFPQARRCGRIGSHVDFAPTVLDLLGIAPPDVYQGRSLVSDGPYRMALLSTMYMDSLLGLRDGDHKYVYNLTTGREEIYDLVHDPAEKHNLAFELTDRTAYYKDLLLRWKAFQRTLIDRYDELTGRRKDDSYARMVEYLHRSRIWLEEGARRRECDQWQAKKLGAFWEIKVWKCRQAREWMFAGVQHLLIGGRYTSCLRLHPPAKGKLVMRMPLPPGTRTLSGQAGIFDKSVEAGGGPVLFRFSLDGRSWTERPLENREGLFPWRVEGPGDVLTVELSTPNWMHRVCCLRFDDLPPLAQASR
ncbi:MAG: sulfatase-like hydrolase/transferase [Deltaproteobacteria bacterium]|nr:sulfatase-like hydrolase/transferase [Deltaproteobacteria bacterium]